MAPSFYSLVQILKEKLRGETTKPQPVAFTNKIKTQNSN